MLGDGIARLVDGRAALTFDREGGLRLVDVPESTGWSIRPADRPCRVRHRSVRSTRTRSTGSRMTVRSRRHRASNAAIGSAARLPYAWIGGRSPIAWFMITRCGIGGDQMACRPTMRASSSIRRSASDETAGTRFSTTPASSRSGFVASQISSMTSATPPMPRSPSADGSTITTAWRAAVNALRVRLPSDGGQSIRIAS